MSPQQTIAHYRIVSKLGEGGMGAVWRATDTKLNRDVAIKVLPDSFANDPDRLARFTREAQVLASLNHPNIAQIYGVEERALILELVEGEELRGPLPLDTSLDYAGQIADALDAAHEKGVVHRDLKPANIKVTPEGRIKVLDFGLAKAISGDLSNGGSPADSPTVTMRATIAGVILGTAAYMSPEQARGRPVDKRADIWAFGVVLYEMLTGANLFAGETITDTLASVVKEQPNLDLLPARVRRLLRACLEKDPKQRLQSIADWRLLLDEERPAAPEAAAPPRRQIGWKVAAIAASVAAIGAGALAWRAAAPEPRPLLRLTAELGSEPAGRSIPVLSPDGSRLLYEIANADGASSLALLSLGQAKTTPVDKTAGARFPFFSRDGQWIGFFDSNGLKKVAVQGGAAISILDGLTNPRGGDFFPDGSMVISPSPASALERIPPQGGAPEPLTDPPRHNQVSHRWPQVLGDGRHILFTAHNSTTDFSNAEIDLLDVKRRVWSTVVRGGYFGRYLPSGHLIYIHDGALFASRFDPDSGRPPGPPVPILDDAVSQITSGHGQLSFSQSGLLAYVSGKPAQMERKLAWIEHSRPPVPVAITPQAFFQPRISPDGRTIAVDLNANGSGTLGLWDIARQSLTPIKTSNPELKSVHFPVWAPDGRHLIFRGSDGQGGYAFWWIRADGGGEAVKLRDMPNAVYPTSISPDGRRLLFTQASARTGLDIYSLPLDLSDPAAPKAAQPEPFLATAGAEFAGVFSPDGKWVAYSDGAADLVRPFTGSGGVWQIPGSKGQPPVWSPAGGRIFFMGGRKLEAVAYEIKGDAFAAGKVEEWSDGVLVGNVLAVGAGAQLDVGRDGRIIAVLDPDTPTDRHASFTVLVNFFDELKRRVP